SAGRRSCCSRGSCTATRPRRTACARWSSAPWSRARPSRRRGQDEAMSTDAPDAPPTPPLRTVRLVRDVRPWGGAPVDLHLDGGVITAITPAGPSPAGAAEVDGGRVDGDVVDGRGLLALPGIVNAHAHVDKSWWGLPWQSY